MTRITRFDIFIAEGKLTELAAELLKQIPKILVEMIKTASRLEMPVIADFLKKFPIISEHDYILQAWTEQLEELQFASENSDPFGVIAHLNTSRREVEKVLSLPKEPVFKFIFEPITDTIRPTHMAIETNTGKVHYGSSKMEALGKWIKDFGQDVIELNLPD